MVVATAVTAVLLLLGGVGVVYASAARADSAHRSAVAELETIRQHNNAIYDALADPTLNARLDNAADVRQAKSAMDDYRAVLGGSIRKVESDLVGLQDEQAQLSSAQQGPLAVMGRAQLTRDRARVDAAARAFASAAKFLTTVDSQTRAINTILAGLVELDVVVAYANNNDLSGAHAQVPQLEQQLQDAATLAKNPGMPPQLMPLIDSLSESVDDLDKALVAIQNKDYATAGAMISYLEADSKAVAGSFDVAAFNAFEHKTLDPYKAAYQDQMRKAGFQIQNQVQNQA